MADIKVPVQPQLNVQPQQLGGKHIAPKRGGFFKLFSTTKNKRIPEAQEASASDILFREQFKIDGKKPGGVEKGFIGATTGSRYLVKGISWEKYNADVFRESSFRSKSIRALKRREIGTKNPAYKTFGKSAYDANRDYILEVLANRISKVMGLTVPDMYLGKKLDNGVENLYIISQMVKGFSLENLLIDPETGEKTVEGKKHETATLNNRFVEHEGQNVEITNLKELIGAFMLGDRDIIGSRGQNLFVKFDKEENPNEGQICFIDAGHAFAEEPEFGSNFIPLVKGRIQNTRTFKNGSMLDIPLKEQVEEFKRILNIFDTKNPQGLNRFEEVIKQFTDAFPDYSGPITRAYNSFAKNISDTKKFFANRLECTPEQLDIIESLQNLVFESIHNKNLRAGLQLTDTASYLNFENSANGTVSLVLHAAKGKEGQYKDNLYELLEKPGIEGLTWDKSKKSITFKAEEEAKILEALKGVKKIPSREKTGRYSYFDIKSLGQGMEGALKEKPKVVKKAYGKNLEIHYLTPKNQETAKEINQKLLEKLTKKEIIEKDFLKPKEPYCGHGIEVDFLGVKEENNSDIKSFSFRIKNVLPGSPAEKSGLNIGDTITYSSSQDCDLTKAVNDIRNSSLSGPNIQVISKGNKVRPSKPKIIKTREVKEEIKKFPPKINIPFLRKGRRARTR